MRRDAFLHFLQYLKRVFRYLINSSVEHPASLRNWPFFFSYCLKLFLHLKFYSMEYSFPRSYSELRASLRNWSSYLQIGPDSVSILQTFCSIFSLKIYYFLLHSPNNLSTLSQGDSGSPYKFRYHKVYLFPRSNQPP